MPKAYPFYDEHYKTNVARIVEWLEDCAPNVHLVGRNGMHRYNNQDHSMFTAMLTVENIAIGSHHDVERTSRRSTTRSRPATTSHPGRDAGDRPRRRPSSRGSTTATTTR